jgi:RES domain
VIPRFDTEPAPDILFRVARKPDVWMWTDLKYAGQGRWDDPEGSYRVLYASTTAFGAYLEKLAQFRPDLQLLAELGAIRANDRGAPKTALAGKLPAGWRARHLLGKGLTDGVKQPLVAVARARSLATLRVVMASVAGRLGIAEIDAGVIRLDLSEGFRRLTQAISRYIYERRSQGAPRYAGIYYLSQHADDVADCAIFEREGPFPVTHLERSAIEIEDADFLRACELHGLTPG